MSPTPDYEPRDTLSIRVTVECRPGTSRARAEQIARSIQRFAEQRPGADLDGPRRGYYLPTEENA